MDLNQEPGQDPKDPGTGQDPAGDPEPKTPELTQEALDALLEQKRKANREAQEAKKLLKEQQKQLDELLAAEKKRKEAEMSEIEKLQARLDEIEKEKAKYQEQLTRQQREALVLKAGADPEFADVLALKLESALHADETLDPEAWLAELKKSKPALFAGGGQQQKQDPAPPSGVPGNPPPKGHPDPGARLQEIEDRLMALGSSRSPNAQAEKSRLVAERITLRRQMET